MSQILDKLHKDHTNFIKLLEFLKQQLQLLKEYKHSDLELILDAIRYMKEYPDLIHHPLENVVFKYYLKHHNKVYEEVNDLLHEHDEMPRLTEKLIEILQAALSDMPQERSQLCACLEEYIAKQVEHMNHEEVSVYPEIDSALSKQEWLEIKSELKDIEDPLFGAETKKIYKALYQQIIG